MTVNPYGSADDLPSVIEMRRALKGAKVLATFISLSEKRKLREAEKRLDSTVDLVESFYRILGSRNWIFTDHLPLDEIRAAVDDGGPSSEIENRVVRALATKISSPFWDLQLFNHEAMRARRSLVERARNHYIHGEWASCSLLLITVVDGFVNDVDTSVRRGLHAREAGEMVAWDRVSGHHLGLTSAVKVFQKGFYKRHDHEVFDVFRNGIVHGMVVSYDNQIVATKSWNILTAVVDWADSLRQQIADRRPEPSPREIFSDFVDHAKRRRYADEFEPYSVTSSDLGFSELEIVRTAVRFFESWKNRRWGLVAEYLPTPCGKRLSGTESRTLEAKRVFGQTSLSQFDLARISFPQASVAVVEGSATITGQRRKLRARWLHERNDGGLAMANEQDSRWILAQRLPHNLVVEQE